MMITLVFLALLMAVFAGWLVSRTINVKPWIAESATGEPFHVPSSITGPRVGLAVFLAVVTSVFALTISAYTMRMAAAPGWQLLPQPTLLWVNTAILLLGSIALQWASSAAKRGNAPALRKGLALGGGCSIAFIVGQYVVWRQLSDAGYYLSANPASAFFFLMTALHALHLLGGLAALLRVVVRLSRGHSVARLREAVGLSAVYWHYLFVVWVILFGVLFIGALPLYELCR